MRGPSALYACATAAEGDGPRPCPCPATAPVTRNTLRQQIADALRDEVLAGRLPAGAAVHGQGDRRAVRRLRHPGPRGPRRPCSPGPARRRAAPRLPGPRVHRRGLPAAWSRPATWSSTGCSGTPSAADAAAPMTAAAPLASVRAPRARRPSRAARGRRPRHPHRLRPALLARAVRPGRQPLHRRLPAPAAGADLGLHGAVPAPGPRSARRAVGRPLRAHGRPYARRPATSERLHIGVQRALPRADRAAGDRVRPDRARGARDALGEGARRTVTAAAPFARCTPGHYADPTSDRTDTE